jgi:integrase
MPRKLRGIRRRRQTWEVNVRVQGHLYTTTFPLLTPVQEMRDWREDQITKYGGERSTIGSIGADIAIYLSRVAAMPTYKQRAAHLELWARELGRDRPRRTVTAEEIDIILQDWLETLAPGTVRKRRTALQSFFAKMNGKKSRDPNPVKASDNPPVPKPEARSINYLLIAAAIDAMPTHRDTKKGLPARLSLSAIRARVLAYTGMPPGILKQVKPTDLQLTAGTVRVVPRHKGAGVEARTLCLTSEGLDAFKAFHLANAYGPFATESLNRSFKRGCAKAGLDPKAVHLYDLRHSFLTELYRVKQDLATVARFGLHAEGSRVTARYAKGANQTVDVEAAKALSQTLATARQLSLKLALAPPVQSPAEKLAAKVGRA